MIVHKETGKAVLECYDKAWLTLLNAEKYRVEPTQAYLERINREIRDGSIAYDEKRAGEP